MRKSIAVVLAAAAMFASASPPHAGELGVEAVFSDGDASIIRAYYQDHGGSQHAKKKKKSKGLPPGIAKNLQRGKRLPPGLAKQTLPGGLVDRLSSPPAGFERIVVSGKVLLVDVATQVIHDVLEDIVFGS